MNLLVRASKQKQRQKTCRIYILAEAEDDAIAIDKLDTRLLVLSSTFDGNIFSVLYLR